MKKIFRSFLCLVIVLIINVINVDANAAEFGDVSDSSGFTVSTDHLELDLDSGTPQTVTVFLHGPIPSSPTIHEAWSGMVSIEDGHWFASHNDGVWDAYSMTISPESEGTDVITLTYIDGLTEQIIQTKKITVNVSSSVAIEKNTITASDVTRSVSNKTQTIKIKAKTKCGHSPIYTLNDYYVYDSPNTNEPKVNQKTGKVTFDKNWMGNAWIEIYVPACEHYTEASKEIKITVRPVSPKLKSVSVPRAKWINIEWQKNSNIDGYQIQMSESPKFNKKKGKMKTYEVPSYRLSWTISGKLIKGKKYYVRMRSYIAGYYEKFYSKWCDTKSVTAR